MNEEQNHDDKDARDRGRMSGSSTTTASSTCSESSSQGDDDDDCDDESNNTTTITKNASSEAAAAAFVSHALALVDGNDEMLEDGFMDALNDMMVLFGGKEEEDGGDDDGKKDASLEGKLCAAATKLMNAVAERCGARDAVVGLEAVVAALLCKLRKQEGGGDGAADAGVSSCRIAAVCVQSLVRSASRLKTKSRGAGLQNAHGMAWTTVKTLNVVMTSLDTSSSSDEVKKVVKDLAGDINDVLRASLLAKGAARDDDVLREVLPGLAVMGCCGDGCIDGGGYNYAGTSDRWFEALAAVGLGTLPALVEWEKKKKKQQLPFRADEEENDEELGTEDEQDSSREALGYAVSMACFVLVSRNEKLLSGCSGDYLIMARVLSAARDLLRQQILPVDVVCGKALPLVASVIACGGIDALVDRDHGGDLVRTLSSLGTAMVCGGLSFDARHRVHGIWQALLQAIPRKKRSDALLHLINAGEAMLPPPAAALALKRLKDDAAQLKWWGGESDCGQDGDAANSVRDLCFAIDATLRVPLKVAESLDTMLAALNVLRFVFLRAQCGMASMYGDLLDIVNEILQKAPTWLSNVRKSFDEAMDEHAKETNEDEEENQLNARASSGLLALQEGLSRVEEAASALSKQA